MFRILIGSEVGKKKKKGKSTLKMTFERLFFFFYSSLKITISHMISQGDVSAKTNSRNNKKRITEPEKWRVEVKQKEGERERDNIRMGSETEGQERWRERETEKKENRD